MGKLDLLKLGGGYVDGRSPLDLDDDQFAQLGNFIGKGRKLVRRRGVKVLTTMTALDQQVFGRTNSVFSFQENTGAWTVIVGYSRGIARFDETTGKLVALSGTEPGHTLLPGATETPAAVTLPWQFLQYLNTGYAVRPGSGLLRFSLFSFEGAGIPAPSTAPTLSEGGVGVVEAGSYRAVWTEYNTQTGAESNPSPVSNTLAHGANKKISWAVPFAITPQADGRKLYRTLPDQVGEYFFVALLGLTETGYQDNVTIDDLGTPVSFDNGLPPGNLRYMTLWNERIVATDGVDVFLSEAQLPESWAEDTVIEVFRDDGHQVRALVALGDRCIIGKTNRTHAITQTGPRKFERVTISDQHGIWSQQSCVAAVAENRLFAFGGDNFYVSDGLSMQAIGTTEIRKLIDSIDPKLFEMVTGAIYAQDSLYIAALPGVSPLADGSAPPAWAGSAIPGPTNLSLVAYDYKNGVWLPLRHEHGLAPSGLSVGFDANLVRKLYATYYDCFLYEFMAQGGNVDELTDFDGTDRTTPIKAFLRTKAFLARGGAGLKLALNQLWVLASSLNQTMKIQVFSHHKQVTPAKERVVSLAGDGWKLYNLSTIRNPGTTLQIGIEYTGASELEIEALSLEVADIFRRGKAI